MKYIRWGSGIVLCVLLSVPVVTYADIIYLQNGKQIKVGGVWIEDDQVNYMASGRIMTLPRDQVAVITASDEPSDEFFVSFSAVPESLKQPVSTPKEAPVKQPPPPQKRQVISHTQKQTPPSVVVAPENVPAASSTKTPLAPQKEEPAKTTPAPAPARKTSPPPPAARHGPRQRT